MSQQIAPGNLTIEGWAQALAELIASPSLTGAKLHLYKDTFSPTPANVQADFAAAECDFTGYVAAVLTYSTLGYDSAGNPTVLSDRAFFQATDSVAPQLAGGCWVENDVTGPPAVKTTVEYYPFPTPVAFNTALEFCGVVLGIQLPGGTGYANVDY